MSHQFKAGDLALIIKSLESLNVGKCVELLSRHSSGTVTFSDGTRCTIPDGLLCWHVRGDTLISRRLFGRLDSLPEGVIEESRLMPLKGDLAPSEQKSQAVPV